MLLVSFIGAPCSGKTTTFLKLLAKLKEGGVPLEFLGEYAREYIQMKKAIAEEEGKLFNPSLTDDEQLHIMQTQFVRENNALRSFRLLPDGVVISDSSPLNSMLYMSPGLRSSQEVRDMARQIIRKSETLLMYNQLFDDLTYSSTPDPNRIHSGKDQQKAIDALIPDMMKELKVLNFITLVGSKEARLSRAYQAVHSKIKYLLEEKVGQEEKRKQQQEQETPMQGPRF